MPALACLALILRSNHAAISGTVFLRQWLRTLWQCANTRLRDRLPEIFSFLHANGADRIAVACSAASCALTDDARVEGIIDHCIEAIRQTGLENIGLVGGARTIRSQAYARPLRAAGINLLQRTPHSLSIRVESGDLDSEAMYAQIKQIASPLRNREATASLCHTHAPPFNPKFKLTLSLARNYSTLSSI